MVGAAAAAATPVNRIGLGTTAEFAWVTSGGRSGLFSIAAAGLALVVALVAPARRPIVVAVAGISAVGLVARTIGGHVSGRGWGVIAIAIHVLAAATWCGTLAALVLTVTGAVVAVDSASQLFATGYGRLLLTKVVLTVVLMMLAWRNRARWLPAARSHHVTAYVSRSRSLTELAVMAVALTMAAALSVTG